jgi:allantoinase
LASLRWLDYQNIDSVVEENHIRKTIEIHQRVCGRRPLGFYQGKPSLQTRSLVCSEGGFLYDSDAYNDDLPYWTHVNNTNQHPHLIIPYTLSENDMKFVSPNGFFTGSDFELYLRNHLDYLLKEAREGGDEGIGSVMSVGLHCRIVGRPGRCSGLEKFIDYALSLGNEVWICRREEIAKHWYQNHWDESWGAQSSELLQTLNEIR